MKLSAKILSAVTACAMVFGISAVNTDRYKTIAANESTEASESMEWGTMEISGGGFVSGIVTGEKAMYARTDVGGAYRYNYDTREWDQMMSFVSEEDRGYLSVDAMCIDPTDDNTIYLLCGCAYFSDARTAVLKSTDGGKTFTEYDVTDLIQVHGNGYGRQCGESIAVDPNNPSTIYCGGDTNGLIVSYDAGETWENVEGFNSLGLFTNTIKWPTWTENLVKTTTATDYTTANGIGTVAISNGKVYVGVSDNTLKANMYTADVGKDNWEPLSDKLPANLFPSRINTDADGNLLIAYVPGLAFASGGGGAYKYNVKTGEITDITPKENTPFGSIVSDKNDSSKLVATTCGLWFSQLWSEDDWENNCVAWGDITFKSQDGGETWTQMAPGNAISWGQPLQANYLQDGGRSWIRNKAIHWSGTMVIDPQDSNRVLITSGNGVFACDDVWETIPTFYFHANGIEEVVALDLVSVPGGSVYSAIGDYDGFVHNDVNEPGIQYQPNMGSTTAIAYCPFDPNVMVRNSQNDSKAYYSKDAGETWIEMKSQQGGQKMAITQLEDGTYRFFCGKSYSDDFGSTWNSITGINSNSTVYLAVDPENPQYVYAGGNDNNGYDPTCKPNNYLFVSSDYGKTFTKQTISPYDKYEDYGRVCAAGNGTVYTPCGFNGLYMTNDYGKTINQLENVNTCFAVGVGKAKNEGDAPAVYIWGEANSSGITGIYRSDDSGKTWVRINDDSHQYGGVGNGKFIVGDMNTYGTVYMSTVGMGIVYGKLTDEPVKPPVTTTTSVTTVPPVTTTTTIITLPDDGETKYGDVDCDGDITIVDVVLLNKYLLSGALYPITDQGKLNADCVYDEVIAANDSGAIQQYLANIITEGDLGKQ